jgi:hypothetical protein
MYPFLFAVQAHVWQYAILSSTVALLVYTSSACCADCRAERQIAALEADKAQYADGMLLAGNGGNNTHRLPTVGSSTKAQPPAVAGIAQGGALADKENQPGVVSAARAPTARSRR